MANDRIYLVCKKCYTHHLLFKYYCGPDMSYAPDQDVGDALHNFMNKHLFECQERFAMDLGTDPGFVVWTEDNAGQRGKTLDGKE